MSTIYQRTIPSVRVNWDAFRGQIRLRIFGIGAADGKVKAVSKPIELQEVAPDGDWPRDNWIELELDQAQQLMDDLWLAGVRPKEAAGSIGQLDAVKYHLEDMRSIALSAIQKTIGVPTSKL